VDGQSGFSPARAELACCSPRGCCAQPAQSGATWSHAGVIMAAIGRARCSGAQGRLTKSAEGGPPTCLGGRTTHTAFLRKGTRSGRRPAGLESHGYGKGHRGWPVHPRGADRAQPHGRALDRAGPGKPSTSGGGRRSDLARPGVTLGRYALGHAAIPSIDTYHACDSSRPQPPRDRCRLSFIPGRPRTCSVGPPGRPLARREPDRDSDAGSDSDADSGPALGATGGGATRTVRSCTDPEPSTRAGDAHHRRTRASLGTTGRDRATR